MLRDFSNRKKAEKLNAPISEVDNKVMLAHLLAKIFFRIDPEIKHAFCKLLNNNYLCFRIFSWLLFIGFTYGGWNNKQPQKINK